MASLFVCCGSRSRVPAELLIELSDEAKAAREGGFFTDEELQRFDLNFTQYADETKNFMRSDALSELTGMPPPIADIFVSAFTAYASEKKDTAQVGLTKHDLLLVAKDFCKTEDDHEKVLALFRFFVANRFDETFDDMKFRMILPVLLCSLHYFDACVVPKKKDPERPFRDFRINAESMGALMDTLIGQSTEIGAVEFTEWCTIAAYALLGLLAFPLSRTFESPDEPWLPIIPASTSRRPSGLDSNLLTVEQMWLLSAFMPAAGGWENVYSSTNTSTYDEMLEKLRGLGAFVVLVQDDAGCVVGGFTSQSLPNDAGYFADTQSMVFQLLPSMRVFKNRGLNENAVYWGEDGLGLGGERGRMALFIERGMDSGHSFDTETFGNGGLTSFEDFEVHAIEVWSCVPE